MNARRTTRKAPPLPMQVQQAAMAHQLGPLRRRYTSVFGGAIAGIVGGLIFVLEGVYTATTAPTVGLVITLIALSITVFFLTYAVRRIGRRVYVCEQGLIIQNRGQLQVFPWSQIAEFSESIIPHSRKGQRMTSTYAYLLRRVDGYQIKLNNTTNNIGELGRFIAGAVARTTAQEQVSRAMHSIQAGQTLTFARFSINRQGIGNGQEFIPWPQVESVIEDQGRVTINQAGTLLNWGSATGATIPHFFVFLAVAQEMIRQTNGR